MTLSTQFLTMLSMVSMGIFFGAALDTYNRFLQRRKRKSWLVFINDILFWVLQGLFIFYVLFHVNQGEVRFYIFIALLCGFAGYQGLLKEIYIKILEKVISLSISVYQFLYKMVTILIYRPIVALVTTFITTLIMLGKALLKLFMWIIGCLLFILKVLFKPIMWILLLLWKLFPKRIKKFVEKLYNNLEGKLALIKKYVSRWISKWIKFKK
jgi:spore cortex biosynthesis protein YabQ